MTTASPKVSTKKRTELIRRFLLNAIKAGNADYLHDAIETFGMTRQAIHAHLSALVDTGHLAATGNTRARTYILGPTRSHIATFMLKGLSESDVYDRDFGFIFKDLPREIEGICQFGFTEMLNNAIDHSVGSEARVEVNRTIETVTISIADNGEGIFNRIARIMGLNDPRESILELSKGKLTTDPDNHTGQGIFFTSRAFDVFYIASGDLLFTHADGDRNDFLMHSEREFMGTNVVMRIALNSERILRNVFDAFTGSADEDFAFNKTVVPVRLALYEGERLVSRSQAKRILNRIEKFSTVILDFSGVDTIGQAFADEIFRVFTRKNPQIALQAINLTPDAERMVIAAKNGI
jgi:anti-sigma regulatory factor (Ser/Thr protein kinase)